MDTPQRPDQNRLLASLPAAEFEQLAPSLEWVAMPLGEILYESGDPVKYAYFPTTAIVSLFYETEHGASSEIAGVGNEGILGISLFMSGNTTQGRAIVSVGGYGYRIKARVLMEEYNRAGGRRAGVMQHFLLRYIQARITLVSQTAVCNRHHSVEQQLCRWLLLALDRLSANELAVTHELIASMIGVRREGITEAAGQLKKAGFIRYHRGHITVLDRSGLASRVCECYAVVKNEFDRMFAELQNYQAPLLASHTHPSSQQQVV